MLGTLFIVFTIFSNWWEMLQNIEKINYTLAMMFNYILRWMYWELFEIWISCPFKKPYTEQGGLIVAIAFWFKKSKFTFCKNTVHLRKLLYSKMKNKKIVWSNWTDWCAIASFPLQHISMDFWHQWPTVHIARLHFLIRSVVKLKCWTYLF